MAMVHGKRLPKERASVSWKAVAKGKGDGFMEMRVSYSNRIPALKGSPNAGFTNP
jgi:hypothetical protein